MAVHSSLGQILQILLLPAALVAQKNGECVVDPDPDKDYFPDKVSVEHSEKWRIEYFNTYKVLEDLSESLTYALYQCGTEPPTGDFDWVFEVPISTIAIGHGPAVPFLQELGLGIAQYDYYTMDGVFLKDPCLIRAISRGELVHDPDEENTVVNSGFVNFLSPFGFSFLPNILLEEYLEKSTQGAYEWLKVYSTFFNLERKANRAMDRAQSVWNCVASSTKGDEVLHVVWVDYNELCNGFEIGHCPNPYCEMVEACGGVDFLTDDDNAGDVRNCNYDRPLFSIEKLIETIADVDLIFFDGSGWDALYEGNMREQLDTVRAVRNRRVYDTQKRGREAWFDEKFAWYYDVVQDFCAVLGRTDRFPRKRWFRNVFTEPVGNQGVCESSRDDSIWRYDGSCAFATNPSPPTAPTPQALDIPSVIVVDVPVSTMAPILPPVSSSEVAVEPTWVPVARSPTSLKAPTGAFVISAAPRSFPLALKGLWFVIAVFCVT